MSGPPEALVLVLFQGRVLEVRCRGQVLPLSPLEMELLDLLARAAPGPVERHELAHELGITLHSLYSLVYRLRRRLGSEAVLQLGSATTRGGRVHGFSGYLLAIAALFERPLSER